MCNAVRFVCHGNPNKDDAWTGNYMDIDKFTEILISRDDHASVVGGHTEHLKIGHSGWNCG